MYIYSATKKNEIVPFATTWMELEIAILREVSPSEKDKCHMISVTWNLRNKTNEQRGKKERGRQPRNTLNSRE